MASGKMEKKFSYFFKKYSFKKYSDPHASSVFFSLWNYSAIKYHRGLALIIWRGTDILKFGSRLKTLKKRKNTYHVAISSYIAKDLDKYKIKYKCIPIVGVNNSHFKPVLMGDEIYVYMPLHNAKYKERYGKNVIDKVRKKCKYKINEISMGQYNRKKLAHIYEKSFCGFRFTQHDGLPNQVIEMGLMGRRSFYNGNIPGSIKWSSQDINKIVRDIEEEAKKINTIDYDYANVISNYVDSGDSWKNIDFWR